MTYIVFVIVKSQDQWKNIISILLKKMYILIFQLLKEALWSRFLVLKLKWNKVPGHI